MHLQEPETFARPFRAGWVLSLGLPSRAAPLASGGSKLCLGRRWQQGGFREMYILINEGAFPFAFWSLFLAVGDSSFPSQQPDVEQRDAGVFLYL